jgi:transcriptional regulator with XRE-family HTH domain
MIDNPVIPEPAIFLGELIATQRRTLGHSQSGLADQVCALSGRATVTRHEISRYEQEKRLPTPKSLIPLAAALQLPTQTLQQATTLTAWRRRIQDDHPETPIDLIPGYLLHPNDDPRPMLLIGIPPHHLASQQPSSRDHE